MTVAVPSVGESEKPKAPAAIEQLGLGPSQNARLVSSCSYPGSPYLVQAFLT